jgi:hypothetical protein
VQPLNREGAYCDAHNHCQPWYEKAFHRDLPTLSERIDARPRAASRMPMTSVRPQFWYLRCSMLADSTMAAHCNDREFGTSRWQHRSMLHEIAAAREAVPGS